MSVNSGHFSHAFSANIDIRVKLVASFQNQSIGQTFLYVQKTGIKWPLI